MRRAEALKSARKNLLGKLTSVARQAGKVLGRRSSSDQSKTSDSNSRRGRVKRHKEEESPERRGGSRASARAGSRRSRSPKKEREETNKGGMGGGDGSTNATRRRKAGGTSRRFKEMGLSGRGKAIQKRGGGPKKRRVSERLKVMLESTRIRRRRYVPEERDSAEEDWESADSSFGMRKSSSSESVGRRESGRGRQQNKKKVTTTSTRTSANKTASRKPFKIRAPERVRTRGYSLVQASKQALQRARRENRVRGHFKKTNTNVEEKKVMEGDDPEERSTTRSRSTSLTKVASRESERKGSTRSEEEVKDGRSTSSPTTPRQVRDVKTKSATPSPKQTGKKAKPGPTSTKSTNHSSSTPSSASTSTSSPSSSSPPTREKFEGEETIPTFHPTEAEFADPLAYISHITPLAEPFGMCKVIPPASWKLDSSKINEDIRFTSQVQYIHRLYDRWGPSVQRTVAINQHLMSELSDLTSSPQIGGVEIDLPQLHSLVEEAGGLAKMADKKNWARVADLMNIPKQAMDRTNRLYDIYCRHVLPYATLSPREQRELEEEVSSIHELQTLEDEAITKGKSMTMGWFSRIARNVQATWLKEDPTPTQIETEYLKIVEERDRHVAVQCGHINTLTQASAFPTRKDSPYSKHSWNLNNVPNNKSSVLKYLGPVAGTTIPTLHVGMLFSTSCWSTDPHGLPYIQYLHSGADILWYCIPKSQRSKFRMAMMETVSSLISNKPRWLKEDCVMVNPNMLKEKGLKVGHCTHGQRQFVVVFPGAHTATVCCGYSVSESVHFASYKWMPSGMDASQALTRSGEKELFSMSALLIKLAQDKEVDVATLTEALPLLSNVIYKELDLRTQLHAAGLRSEKKSLLVDSPPGAQASKRRSPMEEEKACEICERICHLSLVYIDQEEQILCLEHGLKHLQKKKNTKSTRLYVKYNQPELESIVKEAKDRLTHLTSAGSFSNKTRSNVK